MNPEMPQPPHDELESTLTALLLGELPHDQAAALHQKLAQDAELAKLYERLKQTINLVRETISSPAVQTAGQPIPLKLSDERRQKLLQQFKTVAPKEFAPPRRRAMPWLVPVGIAAALMALLAATLLPALSKAKSRSLGHSFRTWSLSAPDTPTLSAPAVTDDSAEHARLAKANPERVTPLAGLPNQSGEGRPPTEVRESAKSPTPTIVLPKATELAYATTTPSTAEGGKPWSTTATLRGFYDDSSVRAGGVGASSTLGSSSGIIAITGGASEGSQPAFAATDFSAGIPMPTDAAAFPNTVPSSRDSEHVKQGNVTTRYAYAAAPASVATPTAPATVPPPVAIALPEEPTRTYGFSSLGPKDSLATDVKNEGEIRLGTEVGRSDDANKLADATTSRVTLQGLTTIPEVKRELLRVPIAPATPLAGPEPTQEEKPKQAVAPGSRPNPSGSYYGGGAYGGYSATQPVPSLGGRGGTPDRSVLRSPKEGGIAGASGGTAITPAPPGPQETAVTEAFSRRYGLIASSQEPAKARILAQGETTPSDSGRSSTEAAGEVLGVQPPEVKLKSKFVEIKQDDLKALGFDWYMGNVLKNQGSIKAQGGTAPSQQAVNSAGTSDFDVAAAGSETLHYQLRSNASAQPGLANADGDKAPMLGELPAVGRLFRSTPEAAGRGAKADAGASTTPPSTTLSGYADTSAQWRFGTGNTNAGSLGRTYPNNITIGDANFSIDPETRRQDFIADGTSAKRIGQQISRPRPVQGREADGWRGWRQDQRLRRPSRSIQRSGRGHL